MRFECLQKLAMKRRGPRRRQSAARTWTVKQDDAPSWGQSQLLVSSMSIWTWAQQDAHHRYRDPHQGKRQAA